MKKLICKLRGHKRGRTKYANRHWGIECKRCGYWTYYKSPHARLVSTEIALGFTGE